MKDPTPKGIDQFIERLIRGKLEDGQLSDCQLSLRDIDQICSAFSGILKGVYHERIEYPKVQQFAIKNDGNSVAGRNTSDNGNDQNPHARNSSSSAETSPVRDSGKTDTSVQNLKGDTDRAD